MDTRRNFASSKELRQFVKRQLGPKTLLSFSCGKDAIASWIALLEDGFEVKPFILEMIPDLSFVNDALAYYEREFGTKIERFPHPSFYRHLTSLIYQPPERCALIESMRLVPFEYGDVENVARDRFKLEKAYVATGVRAFDSLARRAGVKRHGSINHKRKTFFTIYDWTIQDVEDAIVRRNVKLPIDYELFGRSFDGLDYRYLKPLREWYPKDYQKILDWFPLADLELFRTGEL